MVEKGTRDKEVDCYISSPENPAAKSMENNWGAISVIPKQPLKANTTYQVEIECVWQGKPFKKQWSFTTGAKPAPWYHQR
jgi:hypothetical protein